MRVNQQVKFLVWDSKTKSMRPMKGYVTEVSDYYYRMIEPLIVDGKPVDHRVKVFAPYPELI